MFTFDSEVSDEVILMYPIGCGLDIPLGKYYEGPRGEMILNTGLTHTNSFSGPPNSFKSFLCNHSNNVVMDRFMDYMLQIRYDSECSSSYGRIRDEAMRFENLSKIDFNNESLYNHFHLTRSSKMWFEQWFEFIKDFEKKKLSKKGTKKYTLTSPFKNMDGSLQKILLPSEVIVDSLSKAKDSKNGKNLKEAVLGSKEQNTSAMNDGRVKSILIGMLPNLTEGANILWSSVAHMGNEGPKLEMYAPDKNRLKFGKRGLVPKGTSQDFEAINYMSLEIYDAAPFPNSSKDKSAKYPSTDADREPDQKDFNAVRVVITRNKNQSDGYGFDLIVSKNEGVLSALTEYHIIKDTKFMSNGQGFGIEGKDSALSLNLYPDVNFRRTSIRNLLKEDAKLTKAVEMTCQLKQILTLWRIEDKYKCSAEDLFNDIKAQGYDWDELLDTRSWWCFEEDFDKNKNYLSLMDLLRMRVGEYKPYWMQ